MQAFFSPIFSTLLETALGSGLYGMMAQSFLGVPLSQICSPCCLEGAVRLFEHGLLVFLSACKRWLHCPICSLLQIILQVDPNLFRC